MAGTALVSSKLTLWITDCNSDGSFDSNLTAVAA
jgi:hypothetical protein